MWHQFIFNCVQYKLRAGYSTLLTSEQPQSLGDLSNNFWLSSADFYLTVIHRAVIYILEHPVCWLFIYQPLYQQSWQYIAHSSTLSVHCYGNFMDFFAAVVNQFSPTANLPENWHSIDIVYRCLYRYFLQIKICAMLTNNISSMPSDHCLFSWPQKTWINRAFHQVTISNWN